MRGLNLGIAFPHFANQRAHVRSWERVSEQLCLKAIDATSFLLKVQKRAVHRYLGRLRVDQALIQVENRLVEYLFIHFRAVEQLLEVFERARMGL